MSAIKNESQFPKIFYGLHFVPGVAEYDDDKTNNRATRIFLNEDTLKRMNKSFSGKPVFVKHVENVDLTTIKQDADGYVIKSFYNALDGKTWCEFIVITDRAFDAIKKGWRLSNAYFPTKYGAGGLANGVSYDKEVIDGEFEHLAIVENPRYEESIILDEDGFKNYNSKKELELKKFSNSQSIENKGEKILEKKTKGDKKSMFNFFKKTKLENELDLENTIVELPTKKTEITLSKLVNMYDKMNDDAMAHDDHKVKINDEEMTVKELKDRHQKMNDEYMALKKEHDELKKMHDSEEKEEPKKENDDMEEDKKALEKAKELEAHEKKEIAEEKKDDMEEEKEKKMNHFKKLANAEKEQFKNAGNTIDLPMDKLARGRELFSKK